jgi:CTP:molybdopterin cytidylyltransferase MocA
VLSARAVCPVVVAGTGDVGARDVLSRHADRVVEVAIDRDPPGDVDTPDDLAAIDPSAQDGSE